MDHFWHTATGDIRSFNRVSQTIAQTALREEKEREQVAAAEAAKLKAERLRLEERARSKPQERLCTSCGRMTLNPCSAKT